MRALVLLLMGLFVACIGSGCGPEETVPLPCPPPPAIDAGAPPADAPHWMTMPACQLPPVPGSLEVVTCSADPTTAACIVRDGGPAPVYVEGCEVQGKRCVSQCPLVEGGAL